MPCSRVGVVVVFILLSAAVAMLCRMGLFGVGDIEQEVTIAQNDDVTSEQPTSSLTDLVSPFVVLLISFCIIICRSLLRLDLVLTMELLGDLFHVPD